MSSPTPNVDIQYTFGALFLGNVFSAVLTGVTNVQTFIYFRTHNGTGMVLYKLIVAWLWVLDLLHLALMIHSVYYYLVTNFTNVGALDGIVWSFKLRVIVDVFIITGVHSLYAYRIWLVGKGRSKLFIIIVGITMTTSLGVAIASSWIIYRCHSFSDLFENEWAIYLVMGLVTSCDVIIASSLCYIFATLRTGFSSTDSLLKKLMAYTIHTGCLTCLCSIIATIMCAVMPNTLIFFGIIFLLAKLYINSCIALLNAQYYAHPKHSDIPSISEFRAHRPLTPTRESEDDKLEANNLGNPNNVDDNELDHPFLIQPRPPTAVTIEMDSI